MRIFTYAPPSGVPPVIYEDADYLAINKPSGLLTNPGIAEQTHDCALTRLQNAHGDIFLVHRLDCDTSGIVFFAKHKKAEGALKKMLQYRQVKKTYCAIIWGAPAHPQGLIEEPLAADPNNRPLQQVSASGKQAITRYCVAQSLPAADSTYPALQHNTRIQLYPHTGRTHQLRVHMQYLGHPILGDTFYGHAASQAASNRLCLHAEHIAFTQPISGQEICLKQKAEF